MNPYFAPKTERLLDYDRFFNVVKKEGKLLLENNLAHV